MVGFRDDQILMIAPGSQTTLVQFGLPESYTPASLRFPTRMFPALERGKWEAVKIRERKTNGTTEEHGGQDASTSDIGEAELAGKTEEEALYEEDPASSEGAVYPLRDGSIVNWKCFLAFLEHIYNTINPHINVAILLIGEPIWTPEDRATLTTFIFEKLSPSAFMIVDAATSICNGFNTYNAVVVDVGYTKCDVTAVVDNCVCQIGRSVSIPACGGYNMTQKLYTLLRDKGFTFDMCEQLKRSNICEVLHPNTPLPTGTAGPDAASSGVNPAAVASTGMTGTETGRRLSAAGFSGLPRGPGEGTELGVGDLDIKDPEETEGVLDLVSIVVSGKTNEFLAKKEREKAEKAAAKKGGGEVAPAPKVVKLSNSQRVKATFHYDEGMSLELVDATGKGRTINEMNEGDQKRRHKERKEIEVGVERFQAGSEILDCIAGAIHRCILAVPQESGVNIRAILWDNLIIVGNGSKIRGFKEALLGLLHTKYLIAPSSATIFTSELPSNFSTPLATGANTPLPQSGPNHHGGGGVNPLLLAATTASNPGLAPPNLHQQLQMQMQAGAQHHVSHGQTPTSIRLAKAPEHFPVWKDGGFDEAIFLGAQVIAKLIFVFDAKLENCVKRVEFGEKGSSVIHDYHF